MPDFADLSLTEIVDAVASRDPTPGAGPSLAWTCALAAALVEMVSAVMLGKEPELPRIRGSRRAMCSSPSGFVSIRFQKGEGGGALRR